MSKLLSLSISDEELKSSQPPKPSVNAWLQCIPDSKWVDGKYILENSLMSPGDHVADACADVEAQPAALEKADAPTHKPTEQVSQSFYTILRFLYHGWLDKKKQLTVKTFV
mgnify:FL=1